MGMYTDILCSRCKGNVLLDRWDDLRCLHCGRYHAYNSKNRYRDKSYDVPSRGRKPNKDFNVITDDMKKDIKKLMDRGETKSYIARYVCAPYHRVDEFIRQETVRRQIDKWVF